MRLPILAYIDPGYGPLLWQLIIGVALGVAYKIYRVFKKWRDRLRGEKEPPKTEE